ncbi:NPC intracellular cholesterol transporter 2-like [Mya arenaria]|uniref:NPC intracellular cholesterol transporter 2-like n=1 Tax=Mya arenaria TaxID=6604 RepID=UPI0022E7BD0A|nr:NPC intracellular cholesterol transporter 2-like [Mya arenaria]
MLARVLVLSSFIALGYCKTINYKDCGSESGTINSIGVTPCDVEPCTLNHGTNYTVTVNFTSKVNSQTAKTSVHGIIAGVPVPFPVADDCCANKNLKCPVVAGSTDVYSNTIFCDPSYPKIKLVVKWEVMDANSKDIICFEAPLQIA